ncbi:MAG: DUF2207 domain-containing protein [Candidatus Moraniibacteriota bacterium]|jgi:uncharacterized membrane protein
MKKIFFGLFSSIIFCVALVASAENISQFDVDLAINEDATIDVTETIVYEFGDLEKHGIYRTIPVKYKTDKGNNRSIKLSKISVVDEQGQERTFAKSATGGNIKLKIGDADKYVTGQQVYKIKYTVDGAINYFKDHEELYWNVTGDRWEIGLNNINVNVVAPIINDTRCFAGYYGENNPCESVGEIYENIGKNTTQFTHDNISLTEGMTIVVGMPLGTIEKPSVLAQIIWFIGDNWIIAVPFIVFYWMWRRWWKYGKDPKGRGTIIPFYKSPENLSPAEIGMIVDEKVHSRDISAAIINLAVYNRMHIRKTMGEYIFIKTEDTSYLLKEEEKILYKGIFDGLSTEVKASSLKNKFYVDFDRAVNEVLNNIVEKGYYVKNPKIVKGAYMTGGWFMFVGSFFVSAIFSEAAGVALLMSSIPVFGFGFFMPKRTKKGAIMREQILGLKLYLEVAEKDRINFHNAPERTPEHFEELLPYAMALGVEKKWAKQFEDIYKSSPQWYEGTESFNPIMLTNDLRSFNKSTSSTMRSQPSSASSGSSGFSGGGSGGGFGGGGGGSW